MRLSSITIHDEGVGSMLKQQDTLFKIQQQVSTGRRILTPADDPIAAARALDITQSIEINTQFTENRNQASSSLGLVEGVLGDVTRLIQDVQTAAVSAGNAAFSDTDRQSVATELRGRLEDLIGLSNSRDASGQFLFSGYQGSTKPFVQTAAGVQYNGDLGQRQVQVAASRQIATGDSGTNIFERIKDGNGVFTTAATATNQGSGVIDSGAVTDPTSLTGNDYSIDFSVAAGVTTYVVTNNSTATSTAPVAYTSGDAISFDGIQFSIKGEPANNDQFTVLPSTNQSIFDTVSNLIDVLSTPVNGPSGGTNLTNGLNTALSNLENDLDNVLTVRASVGTRLQEIDALQNVGEDTSIQLQQNLSRLQDVDMAKAISDLTQQRVFLEAAQRSFITVSNLSLFDFL